MKAETLILGIFFSLIVSGQVRPDLANLRRSAEQGDAVAEYNLGVLYNRGLGGLPQVYAEAAKWFLRAAQKGYADAQADLGNLYYIGRGVEQDRSKALRWYEVAAAQGNLKGQSQLGAVYAEGLAVPRDLIQAHLWFNLASAGASGQDLDKLAELRDSIAREMSDAQIAEAQRMALEWRPKRWEELRPRD